MKPLNFKKFISGSMVLIIFIAIGFGLWFSNQQMSFVSTETSYIPYLYKLPSIIATTLTVIIFYLSFLLFHSRLTNFKTSHLLISTTFLPLLLTYIGFSLTSVVFLVLFLNIILLAYTLHLYHLYSDLFSKIWLDSSVLLFFIGLHTIFSSMVSPLYWQHALLATPGCSEELPVISPLYKSYIWAKFYSFSNLDYSIWAGVTHSPTDLKSAFIQLLTLIINLPSIDIVSFHQVLHFTIFILMIAGSFGFYLLLRYGLEFRFFIALIGGVLFIFGNRSFIETFCRDSFYFVSSYCLLPYALLAIICSIRKNNIIYALWAGAALSSQFFFLSPHPDGVIYSLIIYTIIAFSSAFMRSDINISFLKKLWLVQISLFAFLLLSLFHIGPILLDKLTGNTIVFGHTAAIYTPHALKGLYHSLVRPYRSLLILFSFISIYYQIIYRRFNPLIIGFITASFFIIAIPDIGLELKITHILPLNMAWGWRITTYYFMTTFVVILYGIQCIIDLSYNKKHRYLYYILLSSFILLIAYRYPLLYRAKNDYLNYNSKGCDYYVSLRAIMVNYPQLKTDSANMVFLRKRIMKFENDVANKNDVNAIKYSKHYHKILDHYRVSRANELSDERFLTLIRSASDLIDKFYLDQRLFCVNSPLLGWDKLVLNDTGPKRILQYNLDGLYTHITNRFSRILGAMGQGEQVGQGAGLLIHNATTTFDTRFVTGYPLLTALYAIPLHYYDHTGDYGSLFPASLSDKNIASPASRKILSIGGIDFFTIRSHSHFAKRTHADLSSVPININKTFDHNFLLLRNHNSYGIAYLANTIKITHPKKIQQAEKTIKAYYRKHTGFSAYKTSVNQLYAELFSLKEKHDVIMELDSPIFSRSKQMAGTVLMENMVGENAVMRAHCRRDKCLLVFNMSNYPGWKAFVNGKRTPIYRINFAFMGVEIPHGNSKVGFLYQPIYDVIFSFISLICFTLLLIFSNSKKRI